MTPLLAFPASLKNKLIVSCQAVPGDPLDDVDTLRRMAVAALRGGAGGLRASGPEHIAAFRRETELPIIGIAKHYENGAPRITMNFASAKAISDAGADIIALDCTKARPTYAEPWRELVARIHQELGKPVMADIATVDEALAAQESGADAVATTLFGYTPETFGHRSLHWSLIETLVRSMRIPTVIEGHVRQPEEVSRAFRLGVFAVVIGAAITQPQAITTRFVHAIPGEK